MSLVSPTFLEVLRETVENLAFDGTCTIYHRKDVETPSVPGLVPDGMGGFSTFKDNMGGSTLTYDAGTVVPCQMDSVSGGGTVQKQDNLVQKTRQTLRIPYEVLVGRNDRVDTADGQPDGRIVSYHILDIYRDTDGLDQGLLIEEINQ